MTTTYMIMEDMVKQLNPAGSCFYANSLPRAALSKKIKEIIINKKKKKETGSSSNKRKVMRRRGGY